MISEFEPGGVEFMPESQIEPFVQEEEMYPSGVTDTTIGEPSISTRISVSEGSKAIQITKRTKKMHEFVQKRIGTSDEVSNYIIDLFMNI